jgi:transglutaminase-like putative cysteine protease
MQLMRSLVLESLNSKRLVSLASRFFAKPDVLKSVESFLRNKFQYVDEKIETLVTPDYMLQGLEINGALRGDCDDISMLHAAILTALDIKVRFVAIRSVQNNPNYDHVYMEAFNGSDWVLFDITVPPGTPIEWFARIAVNV